MGAVTAESFLQSFLMILYSFFFAILLTHKKICIYFVEYYVRERNAKPSKKNNTNTNNIGKCFSSEI